MGNTMKNSFKNRNLFDQRMNKWPSNENMDESTSESNLH